MAKDKAWMFQCVCIFGFFLLFAACDSDVNLNEETFNVYLYPKDKKEEYLGEVKGIRACRIKAKDRALYIHLKKDEWDYTCCLKTSEFDCAEEYQ